MAAVAYGVYTRSINALLSFRHKWNARAVFRAIHFGVRRCARRVQSTVGGVGGGSGRGGHQQGSQTDK